MEIHHLGIARSLINASEMTTTHSCGSPKNRHSGARSRLRRQSVMTLTMPKNAYICPKSIFSNQLSKQPTMCGPAAEFHKQMSLYFSILKKIHQVPFASCQREDYKGAISIRLTDP